MTPAAPVSLPLALAGGGLLIAGVALGVLVRWLWEPEAPVEGHVEMHLVDDDADEDTAIALSIWVDEHSGEAEHGGILN